MIKDAWDYIYGNKSHLNIFGKLFLGVPMFPFIATFVITWIVLDALFSKTPNE